MKLWTAEVAHSPFAASPLIADVNADGHLDIVAAPLSETQTVIDAETGKVLKGTKWPTQMLDTSILASPLQVHWFSVFSHFFQNGTWAFHIVNINRKDALIWGFPIGRKCFKYVFKYRLFEHNLTRIADILTV